MLCVMESREKNLSDRTRYRAIERQPATIFVVDIGAWATIDDSSRRTTRSALHSDAPAADLRNARVLEGETWCGVPIRTRSAFDFSFRYEPTHHRYQPSLTDRGVRKKANAAFGLKKH